MFEWIISWILRITWRVVVTLSCMYTFQNIVHKQGYTIPWSAMCAVTACAILLIITWSSFLLYYKDKYVGH